MYIQQQQKGFHLCEFCAILTTKDPKYTLNTKKPYTIRQKQNPQHTINPKPQLYYPQMTRNTWHSTHTINMHLWHTNDTHAHVKKEIKCPTKDWKLTQDTQHKQAT